MLIREWARPGFVATPRRVIPVLILVVAILALASYAEGRVSPARLAATLVVGLAIATMFALLYVLSRPRGTDTDRT